MKPLLSSVGLERVTLPNDLKFGRYRGKEIIVSYDCKRGKIQIQEPPFSGFELEGASRRYILARLRKADGIERSQFLGT